MQVTLSMPVQGVDGKPITHVDVRPKMLVGDWRSANKAAGANMSDRTFFIVCRLCGLDELEVERMCMADFNKLVELIDTGDTDPKAP